MRLEAELRSALIVIGVLAVVLASCAQIPTPQEADDAVLALRKYESSAWAAGIALIWGDLVLPIPQTAVIAALGIIYGALVGGLVGSLGLIAGASILVGLAIAAAGIRNFSRAATPVPTNQPTRALVTTGIHGWTRNPIYLGMFLLYGGIGVAARSPWTLIFTLPLAITIRYGVVAREEAYLERRFGGVYRDYKARVRRWV